MECDPTSHSLGLSPRPPLPPGCIPQLPSCRECCGKQPKSNQLLIGKYPPLWKGRACSWSPLLSLLHLSPVEGRDVRNDGSIIPSNEASSGHWAGRAGVPPWPGHVGMDSRGLEGPSSCVHCGSGGHKEFQRWEKHLLKELLQFQLHFSPWIYTEMFLGVMRSSLFPPQALSSQPGERGLILKNFCCFFQAQPWCTVGRCFMEPADSLLWISFQLTGLEFIAVFIHEPWSFPFHRIIWVGKGHQVLPSTQHHHHVPH